MRTDNLKNHVKRIHERGYQHPHNKTFIDQVKEIPVFKFKTEEEEHDDEQLEDSEELRENEQEMEKYEEKDKLKCLIQSTTEYLTKHDRDELKNLIEDFKKEAGYDYINSVRELEHLVDKFVSNEYDDDGQLILPKILDVCRKLERSPIMKSKKHRLRMLINDIDQNRFRVKAILIRLNEAVSEEDIADTLESLVKEELISYDQYQKLIRNDAAFELPTIIAIIKDTKIGNGLKFLPRTIHDLKRKLQLILTEVTVTGIDVMRKELFAVLDELLRQRGISTEDYNCITNDVSK